MKISYKGEHGLIISAEHPDESLTEHLAQRISDSLRNEQNAFIREVEVAIRNLKVGGRRTLRSKPIVVEIEKIDEVAKVKGAA